MGLPAVSLVLWWLGAFSAPDLTDHDPLRCRPRHAQVGQASAPVSLRLFADPTDDSTGTIWNNLRRLTAARASELNLEWVVIQPPHQRDPGRRGVSEDRVRRWVLASLDHAPPDSILRVLARDGWRRVHARLATPVQRAELAAEIGVAARPMGASLRDQACLNQLLLDNTRALQTLEAGTHLRAPMVGVFSESNPPELVAQDRSLAELRQRADLALQLHARGPRPVTSEVPPTPPADTFTPAVREFGVSLGGPGLPHTLVVLAHGESADILTQRLPTLLAFVREHPGEVRLQVASVGRDAAAAQLRVRLCAARRSGRELDYLAMLSQPARHRPPRPDWLEAMDEIAHAEPCSMTPILLTHPRSAEELGVGVWLDGETVGRGTDHNLEQHVGGRAPSAWDALFPQATPRVRDDAGSRFP
ncbi:MAG: hypothetical protein V3V08_17925 [Nannocystaceae bacterium]